MDRLDYGLISFAILLAVALICDGIKRYQKRPANYPSKMSPNLKEATNLALDHYKRVKVKKYKAVLYKKLAEGKSLKQITELTFKDLERELKIKN